MQVIVHYPKSKEDIKNMEQKVAEVHAKAIISKIDNMHLSKENADTLIEIISEKAR